MPIRKDFLNSCSLLSIDKDSSFVLIVIQSQSFCLSKEIIAFAIESLSINHPIFFQYLCRISFHYKAEVNELLTQLDNKQNEGLIIIGATNFISNIDDAVLRPGRFDKKIFIGPPDLKARAEAFKMYLESYPQEKLRFDLIAELAENYTFAEIEFICNELKRDAITQNRQLDTDYVCSAVNLYTPKLSDEAIESYF